MVSFSSRWRWVRGRKQAGPQEANLRTELRVKVGVGIVVWCLTLVVSLLLRLVGTPGLITRWLPTMVLLVLPLLVGYVVVYRLFLFPRYLEVCRRMDARKSYEPTPKKSSKKARTEAPAKQKVRLMPGKVIIVMGLLPVVYYFVTTFVSMPPDVPVQNHDHLWHQLGTLLTIPLGYLIGLAISLGDEWRPLVPFCRCRESESSVR